MLLKSRNHGCFSRKSFSFYALWWWVVGPVFPRLGAYPTEAGSNLLFWPICPENGVKLEEHESRGGRPWHPPPTHPDPPMVLIDVLLDEWNVLVTKILENWILTSGILSSLEHFRHYIRLIAICVNMSNVEKYQILKICLWSKMCRIWETWADSNSCLWCNTKTVHTHVVLVAVYTVGLSILWNVKWSN